MPSTSRRDEDIVAELETLEEVLLYLDPDEIDYVNNQPLDLQDGAARRLALSGLRKKREGERRHFSERLASLVEPFSSKPSDPLRKYLFSINFIRKTRHLGGARTLLSSGALGISELDMTHALQESESINTPSLSDYLSPSSSDRGSRAPLWCALQTDLLKLYTEYNASQITSFFEQRSATALLDQPLADVLWEVPKRRRDEAVEAIGELKTFLYGPRAFKDVRHLHKGATTKTILECATSAYLALLGAILGGQRQPSHDHQLPVVLIELESTSSVDGDQDLLAFVTQFERMAQLNYSQAFFRVFGQNSVPYKVEQDTEKIVASGSQVLLQKIHLALEHAAGGQAHTGVVLSTENGIVAIWLPVFAAPYSEPPRGSTTLDSAQGSFLLFSPITQVLQGGLFNVFLAHRLEESFTLYPPSHIRYFSNIVLTRPCYRVVVAAYASQGLYFWGDPHLAPTAISAPSSADSSSPPPLLPEVEGEDEDEIGDDGKKPPVALSCSSMTTVCGGLRASGESIRGAAVQWPSGGSGGDSGSSQVRAHASSGPSRIASLSEVPVSEETALTQCEKQISPVSTCAIDVLLKLRSSSSLRRTWQGLQANDTLVRLPPLLPFTINGLPTPAPSPDRPPAKRRNASTTEDGGDESSSSDELVLEMEHVLVGFGSAGTVYRGKVAGASVLIKVSHTFDGLATEMENYQKLEMALGKEGEEGLELLTPVVGGRFRPATGEGELMIMEDAGTAMPRFSDWTCEQKSEGLRLLERLHKAGLQHGDVAERNFVLADDGTLRLGDLEHAQAHSCGGKCRELEWFRWTVVWGKEGL
ncbi:hypothetical protein JCM10021v2_002677 [Rhodotorula toruloides]